MVKFRSKLHLSRQGRKSSLSHVSPLAKCNTTVPSRTAGSVSEDPRDHSSGVLCNRVALEKLPGELLARIASFCAFGDVVRLRCSCQALRVVFDISSTLEKYLRLLVSLMHHAPTSTLHCMKTLLPYWVDLGLAPPLMVDPCRGGYLVLLTLELILNIADLDAR